MCVSVSVSVCECDKSTPTPFIIHNTEIAYIVMSCTIAL